VWRFTSEGQREKDNYKVTNYAQNYRQGTNKEKEQIKEQFKD